MSESEKLSKEIDDLSSLLESLCFSETLSSSNSNEYLNCKNKIKNISVSNDSQEQIDNDISLLINEIDKISITDSLSKIEMKENIKIKICKIYFMKLEIIHKKHEQNGIRNIPSFVF